MMAQPRMLSFYGLGFRGLEISYHTIGLWYALGRSELNKDPYALGSRTTDFF